MTLPARSALRPMPIMLLEQLVRFWARMTAWPGGLVASDRDMQIVANLYTTSMPEANATKRKTPACSLALGPATTPATNEAVVHIGVIAEARGQTQDQVLTLLEDLRSTVVRPGDRPFGFTPRLHGGTVQNHGIIGAPPVAHFDANATLGVYRVLRLDPVTNPQIIAPAAGVAGTDDGEVSGQFVFQAVCVAIEMPRPIAAFNIKHNTVSTLGHVKIDNGLLSLTQGTDPTQVINLASAGDDTIGELFAHAVGPHFTFENLNGAVSARQSLDLVEVSPAVSLEDVDTMTVYVWG